MSQLFGVPADLILLALVLACGVLLVWLIASAGRGAILFRIGFRNVPRRKLRTVLVIAGLAVSTAVLTSAFATGDTMTYNIRLLVTNQIGRVDELIVMFSRQPQRLGPQDISTIVQGQLIAGSRTYFGESEFQRIVESVGSQPAVAGMTPAIVEPMVAANPASQQVGANLNVIGLASDVPDVFGSFVDSDGHVYTIADLGENDVYLNTLAATALNAKAGDPLILYFGEDRPQMTVGAVVDTEGLGAGQPALILPLTRLQQVVGKPGEINRILVANTGDAATSVERSDEVVTALRGLLVRDDFARRMYDVLSTDAAQAELTKIIAQTEGPQRTKLEALQRATQAGGVTPELKTLLGDPEVIGRVSYVAFLLRSTPQGQGLARQLRGLNGLTVIDIKQAALARAEEYGAVITSVFLVVGLLAIAAALALVFLVFVLLAAERRGEMGVSRAIGMRRGQLVATFLFEGLVYDLFGALLGVALGVAAGAAAVNFVSGLLTDYGVTVVPFVSPRSMAITYLGGVLLTFLAVGGAAWRVSRLNVVAAIRDLPEAEPAPLGDLIAGPFRQAFTQGAVSFRRRMVGVVRAFGALLWALLARGPLLLVIGLVGRQFGALLMDWAVFSLGVTAAVVGLVLFVRWLAVGWAPIVGRLVVSAGTLVLLAYWLGLPSLGTFGEWPLAAPNIAAFALRGLMVVGMLVWLTAANLRLVLLIATLLLRPFRVVLPAIRLAATYPAARPWRTAMALMMFSLVIFTMTLATVQLNVALFAYADPSRGALGYDIRGEPASTDAPPDVRTGLETAVASKASDFAAIGTLFSAPAEELDLGVQNAAWQSNPVYLMDDEFVSRLPLRLVAWAPQYATREDVWNALATQPNLALISTSNSPGGSATTAFEPRTVWVRNTGGGPPVKVQVIGRVDPDTGIPNGIVAPESAFTNFQMDVRSYYFKVEPDVNPESAALGLNLSFGDAGLRTQVVGQELARAAAIRTILTYLLQVFLGLGLVAGIAALGLLGVMAVVERRNHIGVLRAIGFRRWLVVTTFLLESMLTAGIGIVLGAGAGLVVAREVTATLARGRPEIRFVVPWAELLLIIGGALVASLLTAVLPALQAGDVRPADAIKS